MVENPLSCAEKLDDVDKEEENKERLDTYNEFPNKVVDENFINASRKTSFIQRESIRKVSASHLFN